MANNTQPTPFLAAIKSPLVDKDGQLTWIGNKLFTDWNTRLENGLNLIGQFIGNISSTAHIGSRPEDIGTTVNHLNTAGHLDSLTSVAADVDLDHVADTAAFQRTTPAQVVGANTAAAALIAAASGQALVYSHIFGWGPGSVAYADITGAPTPSSDTPIVAHEWINGYSAGLGAFSQSQPDFGDVSGVASAGQVPALSGLSGQITAGQLPAAGLTVTIVTAKLTVGGANGSMQFQNGILIAQTPAT